MHPSHRRNAPRTTHSRSAPIGRRLRRRSLVGVALTGAIVLAGGGVVAARGPEPSGSTGGSGLRSTGTTVRPVAGRPGLPDVPWLAERGDGRWVYGRGNRPPIHLLPAGELGLAVDRERVATMLPTSDGHSIVRFRDTASGRELGDVPAPIWVSAGAFTPHGLVLTGYGDATMATDGGMLALRPGDAAPTTLVPGAAFAAAIGAPVARGDVLVSPSGRTVASNACGPERCALQVVDLETGLVSRPVDGDVGFLRSVNDSSIVTTDDAGRWIRGRAIADGRELWRHEDLALIEPATLEDGSVVGLIGSAKVGWAISGIDVAGHLTELVPRGRSTAGPPHLWRAVMTPGTVVYGPTAFEEALGTHRETTVSFLAARDGRTSTAPVQLPVDIETVP